VKQNRFFFSFSPFLKERPVGIANRYVTLVLLARREERAERSDQTHSRHSFRFVLSSPILMATDGVVRVPTWTSPACLNPTMAKERRMITKESSWKEQEATAVRALMHLKAGISFREPRNGIDMAFPTLFPHSASPLLSPLPATNASHMHVLPSPSTSIQARDPTSSQPSHLGIAFSRSNKRTREEEQKEEQQKQKEKERTNNQKKKKNDETNTKHHHGSSTGPVFPPKGLTTPPRPPPGIVSEDSKTPPSVPRKKKSLSPALDLTQENASSPTHPTHPDEVRMSDIQAQTSMHSHEKEMVSIHVDTTAGDLSSAVESQGSAMESAVSVESTEIKGTMSFPDMELYPFLFQDPDYLLWKPQETRGGMESAKRKQEKEKEKEEKIAHLVSQTERWVPLYQTLTEEWNTWDLARFLDHSVAEQELLFLWDTYRWIRCKKEKLEAHTQPPQDAGSTPPSFLEVRKLSWIVQAYFSEFDPNIQEQGLREQVEHTRHATGGPASLLFVFYNWYFLYCKHRAHQCLKHLAGDLKERIAVFQQTCSTTRSNASPSSISMCQADLRSVLSCSYQQKHAKWAYGGSFCPTDPPPSPSSSIAPSVHECFTQDIEPSLRLLVYGCFQHVYHPLNILCTNVQMTCRQHIHHALRIEGTLICRGNVSALKNHLSLWLDDLHDRSTVFFKRKEGGGGGGGDGGDKGPSASQGSARLNENRAPVFSSFEDLLFANDVYHGRFFDTFHLHFHRVQVMSSPSRHARDSEASRTKSSCSHLPDDLVQDTSFPHLHQSSLTFACDMIFDVFGPSPSSTKVPQRPSSSHTRSPPPYVVQQKNGRLFYTWNKK